MEVPSWQPRIFTFRRRESVCLFRCRPDERDRFLAMLDDLIQRANGRMADVEKWKRRPGRQ
jgi:hypothetical protein